MAEWIIEIGDGNPIIKNMIPLVRCKDCKYWTSSDCKWDEYQAKERTLDSFCSFGKRKEEKQNE